MIKIKKVYKNLLPLLKTQFVCGIIVKSAKSDKQKFKMYIAASYRAISPAANIVRYAKLIEPRLTELSIKRYFACGEYIHTAR